MVDLNGFVAALRLHNWYFVAAVLLMLVIQGFRKWPVTSPVWQKVPNGLRFLPGVVLAFAVGFVNAFNAHDSWSVALMAGVGGIFGIAMPAMGGAALLKESPLPWDGGAGGVPLALVLVFVLPNTLTGCKSNSANTVREELAAYNAAAVALDVVEKAALSDPTSQTCATATPEPPVCHLLSSVNNAKAALNILKNELVNGPTESSAQKLTAELNLVKTVLDEATADGAKVPPELTDSIDVALKLISGS